MKKKIKLISIILIILICFSTISYAVYKVLMIENEDLTFILNVSKTTGGGSTPTVQMANAPELADGMIPIKWDNTNNVWVKTSILNTNNSWYDYNNKQWANAALVAEDYRTVEDETTIPMSSIYAMFVWIPRYVYKIPTPYYHTALTETDLQADTTNPNFIEIHFSDGTNDLWDENIVVLNNMSINVNASNNWMTCPAFTFGTTELTGFWMAKFKASEQNGNIYVKQSETMKYNVSVDNAFIACRNMEANTIYGWDTASVLNSDATFSTDNNHLDSHLTKNSEWAATCFLANSQYGVNKTAVYNTVGTFTTHITGESANSTTVYTTNVVRSTTGNAYGVYDMASTVWDSVAGFIYKTGSIGNSTTLAINALDKYKDIYKVPQGVSYTLNVGNQASVYGLFEYINGAAIWESSSTGVDGTTGWFLGRYNIGSGSNLLITRGGSTGGFSSIFSFGYSNGNANSSRGYRPVIVANSEL
ncbi:MAG: hypothetical protein Q4G09_06390 [Clostridia bacterium]|nr:hypothetical protein [Clostridia bacterium]